MVVPYRSDEIQEGCEATDESRVPLNFIERSNTAGQCDWWPREQHVMTRGKRAPTEVR